MESNRHNGSEADMDGAKRSQMDTDKIEDPTSEKLRQKGYWFLIYNNSFLLASSHAEVPDGKLVAELLTLLLKPIPHDPLNDTKGSLNIRKKSA